MKLEDIRKRIDEIDKILLDVLMKRMELSEHVANSKINSDTPIYSEEREEAIINNIRNKDLPYTDEIICIMKSIMSMSRELQYGIILKDKSNSYINNLLNKSKNKKLKINRIAYSGKSGSYSEAAAIKMYPNVKYINYYSFYDAIQSVQNNETQVVVLPLENSTSGIINDIYNLLAENSLYIVKSLSYRIRHNLIVLNDTALSDIDTIISHPQALSQCSEFIRQNNLNILESLNTAYAVDKIKRLKKKNIAAIGSHKSAISNELDILDIDINNVNCNQTRFIALSKYPIFDNNCNKISTCFKLTHKAGALSAILFMLSGLNLNLTKIQSQPIPDKPWEYMFFLDFLCKDLKKSIQGLYIMEKELLDFQLLGFYSEQ